MNLRLFKEVLVLKGGADGEKEIILIVGLGPIE